MSKLFTTDGLVIKSFPSGEADLMLYLLTPERGRLTVKIKHARSGKSKLGNISQLFTYGNFEISESHGFLFLRSGSVLHSFYGITADITAMALGTYLCDVAATVCGEEDAVNDACCDDSVTALSDSGAFLRMLLNSLYVLDAKSVSPRIVKGVFELRAAAMSGFRPRLTTCTRCGNAYPPLCYLDIMNGSLLCADCKTALNRPVGHTHAYRPEELGERSILIPLSASVLAAARYAMTAPEKKLFSFALQDDDEERAFAKCTETYLLNHLEHGLETLNFYHAVAD